MPSRQLANTHARFIAVGLGLIFLARQEEVTALCQ
jgi:hypothetical protein